VLHTGAGLYAGLPNPFAAGRYHSLIARRVEIPDALEVTAWTAEGEVMGVRHKELALEGVQFHPESILTPEGPRLLKAFLDCGTTT
jgi:anthranilate/para-aminobenzoate synthase component II